MALRADPVEDVAAPPGIALPIERRLVSFQHLLALLGGCSRIGLARPRIS
jgi:hypothetical protein